MVMNEYSTFPKAPALLEPHHQIVSCHNQDTHWEGLTPLQRCSWCILQPQPTEQFRDRLLRWITILIYMHLGTFLNIWNCLSLFHQLPTSTQFIPSTLNMHSSYSLNSQPALSLFPQLSNSTQFITSTLNQHSVYSLNSQLALSLFPQLSTSTQFIPSTLNMHSSYSLNSQPALSLFLQLSTSTHLIPSTLNQHCLFPQLSTCTHLIPSTLNQHSVYSLNSQPALSLLKYQWNVSILIHGLRRILWIDKFLNRSLNVLL